ncbi:hypothetical protein, partial [Brevibacillus sp. SIMBA_076]|uniref:hypothetical protein n=1 Tax=Brevibacillus sp. SIMBA_076 TaxID=3085814 RepID=UPI00397AC6D5
MIQRATFTFHVNEDVGVTRSVDVPVGVKQAVPSKEEEPKQESKKQQQELKTEDVSVVKIVVQESGAPP